MMPDIEFTVGGGTPGLIHWHGGADKAEACELCEGDGTLGCSSCGGSGEGMHDGTTCRTCKGKSEVPCECQDERLKEEADAKDAAEEARYDERRDEGR